MKSEKVLIGLLAGVAVGALLGVLFAPEKGSVTRKNISSKGQKLADDLTEKLDDFIDTVKEKFEEVLEEVENVKFKSDTVKDDVKSASK
jgi:gas vesicle protein